MNDTKNCLATFEAGWLRWLGFLFLNHASVRNRASERFDEKALSGLSISRRTQEKLTCVSFCIDSAREIHPDLLDVDRCLIHFPGVIPCFQMLSRAFCQLGGVVLKPTEDRCMKIGRAH